MLRIPAQQRAKSANSGVWISVDSACFLIERRGVRVGQNQPPTVAQNQPIKVGDKKQFQSVEKSH